VHNATESDYRCEALNLVMHSLAFGDQGEVSNDSLSSEQAGAFVLVPDKARVLG
jgi:hypothetical protein